MAGEEINIGESEQFWIPTKDSRIKRRPNGYFARFTVNGIRIQKFLETKNFALAVQLVDKIQAEALLGNYDADPKGKLFREAWKHFLDDKAIGAYTKPAAKRTMQEYREFGDRYFLPILGDKRVDKFKVDDFTEYLAKLKEAFPNVTRFENHYKYLSGFFNWADRKELTPRRVRLFNPDVAIKANEEDDGLGRVYSEEELKKILDACGDGAFGLWIRMGMLMGMRNSEITQLKKDRIDLVTNVIRLKKFDTKTRQARVIGIPRDIILPLVCQMGETQDSECLFPNHADRSRPMFRGGFDHRWRELLSGLGITGTFHELRHTYATKIFARADLSPFVICKSLGMTMRTAEKYYLHFDETQLKTITEGFKVI